MFGNIEAFFNGLDFHRVGRATQADENSYYRTLSFYHSDQVPYLTDLDLSAFDLNDDFLRLAAVIVKELYYPIDSGIRPLFLILGGISADLPDCPPFKLKSVLKREGPWRRTSPWGPL